MCGALARTHPAAETTSGLDVDAARAKVARQRLVVMPGTLSLAGWCWWSAVEGTSRSRVLRSAGHASISASGWDTSGGVSQGECDDDDVVERADRWQELRFPVDRGETQIPAKATTHFTR